MNQCKAIARARAEKADAAVFEMRALRARSVRAAPSGGLDRALIELAGREFRFAVPGVPSVRLPRDPQALANFWKSISDQLAQSEVSWPAAAWTALTTPTSCIPLIPREGAGQEFAAASFVDLPNSTSVLSIVNLALTRTASRFSQPAIVRASARVIADLELGIERLEDLYLNALPQARAAARQSAARAVWLGGSTAVARLDPQWRERIEAVGAVLGLRIEVVEEPARHARSVRTALGTAAAPAYLLIWRPMCRSAGQLVDLLKKTILDGEVIHLDEATFPDVLVETRLALLQRRLGEPPAAVASSARKVPGAGEERFYIKVGGAKVGDVLIEVPDCGHGQWGSDARRKAPRALMGVELLEGVRPAALFRCAKCTKHRWRARF